MNNYQCAKCGEYYPRAFVEPATYYDVDMNDVADWWCLECLEEKYSYSPKEGV